jgi:outer membrane protein assembly factor BamB
MGSFIKLAVAARISVACLSALFVLSEFSLYGADWGQFRGPQGNGVLSDAKLPKEWDDSKVVWSADVPGGGWSAPIQAGDKIFLTTAVSEEIGRPKGFGRGVASMGSFSRAKPPSESVAFEVHCFSLSDGSLIWKQEIESRKPEHKIHPSNTYATETPATDGEHVFVYFASIGVVACLDLDGKEVWKRDLGSFPSGNGFGTGSSLALGDGLVYVQSDNDQSSFLVALDAKTGNDRWRVERDGRTSWSTPILWTNNQRTELVVCGSGFVTSYDPATGEELWNLTGVGGSFTSSPASDLERIYFGNSGPGSRGPLVAVNAGASGELDLTGDIDAQEGIAWHVRSAGPGMASPVVVDECLYVVSTGILSCHDAKTGERIYRERLPEMSNAASSLIATADCVYILGEQGKTAVVKAGREYELIAENIVDGLFWSTPSIVGNQLLLRSATQLHCIGGE